MTMRIVKAIIWMIIAFWMPDEGLDEITKGENL